MASVYMLRAFIRAMHNRVGPDVESRDMSVRDGIVLVPLVLLVLVFALFDALLHGFDGLFERQAAGEVLLGRPAHLAVDHAVGGEVFDELARDAA